MRFSPRWAVRDWMFNGFAYYASGIPLAPPTANATGYPSTSPPARSATSPSRRARYQIRTGQPLYLQDLNCHCFDPNTHVRPEPGGMDQPSARTIRRPDLLQRFPRRTPAVPRTSAFGRQFRMRESLSLNVRAEFTNILNRTYFNNPTITGTGISPQTAPTCKLPTGGNGACTPAQIVSGFGAINTSTVLYPPRTGQSWPGSSSEEIARWFGGADPLIRAGSPVRLFGTGGAPTSISKANLENRGVPWDYATDGNSVSPKSSGTHRLPLLDGIRALAILLVLAAHSSNSGLHQGLPVVLGNCGVSLFFVLSGYLITRSMLLDERRHGRFRLGNFYFRRALRIFPAFYTFLIVLAILETIGVVAKSDQTTWLASLGYFRNLAGAGWETGHLWSLALEEQFYLFWPVLFILTKRHRLACIAIAVILFTAWRTVWVFPQPADMSPIYIRPDLRLDTFLIGGAFAIGDWRWVKAAPAHLITAFLLLWYPLSLNTHWLRPVETPVAAFAMAALIAWLARNPESRAARMFSVRAAVLVGTWSYSIYLWQQLFLGPNQHWWTLPALALVSMGSYYLIERPSLALRDRGLSPLPATSQPRAWQEGGTGFERVSSVER